MTGRILGLDPGERRIGVALSDPLGIIAQPHSVIDLRSQNLVEELKRIIAEEGVITIVIGLPVSLDGAERAAAARAREFAATVAQATGLQPVFADERFTTSVAEAALIEGNVSRANRRTTRDKVAAAVMLQGHLDSCRYQQETPDDVS
ncbi:MAG: Holliday junction resolvase RuvX [Acidimicrobiia bacterium]|nr:Holliday junction resolvase RuvX [Acidimicrobiia bacterium]